MKLYGLIGNPLTHSFSEKYFKHKFEKELITDADFKLFQLPHINDVSKLVIENIDLQGFSVTIPFKKQIFPFLTEIDEVAQQIGAVNSVKVIRKENKIYLKGYNTDIIGFKCTIDALNIENDKINALVLGSGGASQAVIYVLKKLNIPYLIVSRNPSANQIGYQQLNESIMDSHQLIINSTPLGMFPDINSCPLIPYEYINSSHYLVDLTYNPPETLFLKKGKDRGAKIINGKLMLEKQADASWNIWYNK